MTGKGSEYRKTLTVTLPDGSKKKLQFYAATEKEAARKRDRARAEYEAGLLVLSPKTTVAQYAEVFAQELKGADSLSRLQRLIVDQMGYLQLDEVRPANIRASFRLLDGQSESSITKACALIRRFFRQAVADGLLVRDPCLNIPRPQAASSRPKRRALTEAEEKVFLSLLADRVADGKHAYDIGFGIAYACGLRPGEVRALARTDIILTDNPVIRVNKACKNKTTEIGPPKTPAGVRDVPIPAWFVPLLRQGMSKTSLFAVPGPDGQCVTADTFRQRWEYFYRQMHRRAGAELHRNKIIASPFAMDLDAYCLRHTYCTNLAYAGVPEVVAMKWMGHEDPDMVRMIYADAENSKLLRRSVELLNAKPNEDNEAKPAAK